MQQKAYISLLIFCIDPLCTYFLYFYVTVNFLPTPTPLPFFFFFGYMFALCIEVLLYVIHTYLQLLCLWGVDSLIK